MKPILLLLIFCCTNHLYSQNYPKVTELMPPETLEQVEKAVNLYWNWEKDEDPKLAVAQLESIAKKQPKNWIAPYWGAYIATQIGNSIKSETAYLGKAQILLDQAEKAFVNKQDSITYAYFPALQCLIYRLKSFRLKEDREKLALREKERNSLQEGYKLHSANPILWVMTATSPDLDHANNIGNRLASAALLQKAKDAFVKIRDRSPADISYWNEHWINPWMNNLISKKVKEMEIPSISNDFDFIIGEWEVTNRRRKEWLTNNQEWAEFSATCKFWKHLNGMVVLDEFYGQANGQPFVGSNYRVYNKNKKEWTNYWSGTAFPDLGLIAQGKGTFENGVGTFLGEEIHNGKKVKLRLLWKMGQNGNPHWEQAYFDETKNEWETNWIMNFERI